LGGTLAPLTTYVVLLRGVTPSGRNRVPMADLREALADAGLQDVRTYIQSGNAIVRSALAPAALQALVHDVIAARIGADLSIFVRTRQELQDVVEANPFAAETAQATDRIYYTLLASPPDTGRLQALHALDTGADRVQVVGQTLYTLYATRHSDSRFNNNFYERQLRLAATTRNFNTLTRLIELSA
jgi:uncharacterized protein (DUF1697 family)